jgi:FKBP-type peptidyl-prolyl cis-trans isomerase
MKRYVVFALALLLASLILTAQTKKSTTTTRPAEPRQTKVTGPGTALPGGLEYWDIKKGTGPEAAKGDAVYVQYAGWLTNGKLFDTSLRGPHPKPFDFTIGAGQVIKGWEEGVAGMKVGGKRQLKIPPQMAYGAQGYPGVIPPNSTLIFDVTLVGIKGKK